MLIIVLSQAKKKPRKGLLLRQRGRLLRHYTDSLSFFVEAVKFYDAIDPRKQREVPAHADIFSRVNAGAELPHDDISGPHGLTAKNLHSTSLPLAVAPVAGTALPLFVSHRYT